MHGKIRNQAASRGAFPFFLSPRCAPPTDFTFRKWTLRRALAALRNVRACRGYEVCLSAFGFGGAA